MGLGFFYYLWLYCFHVQRFERANDGIVQNIRKYFWLCCFFLFRLWVCALQWHSYLGVVWHYIFRMRIKVRRKWVKKLIILFVYLVCTLFRVSVSVCLPFWCVKSVRSVCIDTMVIPITLIVYGIETNFHMHTKTFWYLLRVSSWGVRTLRACQSIFLCISCICFKLQLTELWRLHLKTCNFTFAMWCRQSNGFGLFERHTHWEIESCKAHTKR